MLIYDILKADHENLKGLLNKLVALDKDTPKRHELIEDIRNGLIPHSRAEESVFYNSLRIIDVAKDIVMHGYKEHMEAETLLRVLQVRDSVDAEWIETARQLKKGIEHHIEEEEGKIFPVARKVLTETEASMMAEAFENLKPEIESEGFLKNTVDLVTNLMPPRFVDAFKSESETTRVHNSLE